MNIISLLIILDDLTFPSIKLSSQFKGIIVSFTTVFVTLSFQPALIINRLC